jgi:cytochrome c oxidase subunit 1
MTGTVKAAEGESRHRRYCKGKDMVLNLVLTLVASRPPAPDLPQFAEALSGADHAPIILDRWRPWLALAAALIVIAYGPTLVRLVVTTSLQSPGYRVW